MVRDYISARLRKVTRHLCLYASDTDPGICNLNLPVVYKVCAVAVVWKKK
jgi:hypothetical protein